MENFSLLQHTLYHFISFPCLEALLLTDSIEAVHQSRQLVSDTPDTTKFLPKALMKNCPLYIADSSFNPPNKMKYFKMVKAKLTVCVFSGRSVKTPEALRQQVNRWASNAAWNGKSRTLVIFPPFLQDYESTKLILTEFWNTRKALNIYVFLEKFDTVEVYTGHPYSATCQLKITQVTAPVSRRISNINGCMLKAVSTTVPPYVYSFKSGIFTEGLEVKIFQMLSKMLNFTYEFMLAPPKENAFTTLVNGTPAGTIGLLSRHEADIMFHGVRLSWGRAILADASDPYLGDSFVWASPLAQPVPPSIIIWLVFDRRMWVGTIAAMIGTSLLVRFLIKDIILAFLYVYGVTLNVSQPDLPRVRRFLWFYFFYVSTVSAAYQAGLFKLLAEGVNFPQFPTVMDALQNGFSLSVFPTMQPDLKQNSPKFYSHITKGKLVTWSADSDSCFEQIAQQKPILRLTTRLLLRFVTKRSYTTKTGKELLTALSERFSPYEAVFYMSKDHPLMSSVRICLRRLVEGGWITKFIEELLERARIEGKRLAPSTTDTESKILSLEKMSGAFMFLLEFLTVSLIVLLFEAVAGLRRSKRQGASALRRATKKPAITYKRSRKRVT